VKLAKSKSTVRKYTIDYLDKQAILNRAKELQTTKFVDILREYYLKELV
jgi:hypothetical protein